MFTWLEPFISAGGFNRFLSPLAYSKHFQLGIFNETAGNKRAHLECAKSTERKLLFDSLNILSERESFPTKFTRQTDDLEASSWSCDFYYAARRDWLRTEIVTAQRALCNQSRFIFSASIRCCLKQICKHFAYLFCCARPSMEANNKVNTWWWSRWVKQTRNDVQWVSTLHSSCSLKKSFRVCSLSHLILETTSLQFI